MYSFLKFFLFKFDPEKIHYFVTYLLKIAYKIAPIKSIIKANYTLEDKILETNVFGLRFKNPVGLAAGFDKNGEYIEEFANFGFGFIEVGTVTPLPQAGNDKPRMFRLKADNALINRMGFNNNGIHALAKKLAAVKRNGLIIGGNIGKNKNTPNDEAVNDYVMCFEALFNVVDYFVVNVSSPNTPNLRALQEKEPLKHILHTLQKLNNKNNISRPILLKIAPDLNHQQLDDIVEIVLETKIAGVIATNTTITRQGLTSAQSLLNQMGGLSGKPLHQKSTDVIRYLAQKSKNSFPIIGVGGIHSAKDALEKIQAGASLIQVYTGFVYEGPGLVKQIIKAIKTP
ncbi:MAG: quinone-dependent dihydroorotate dehydrogenase [Sphingobacteriales bacterium]|nr:MAG: quinone-dependent dihydroorotate dehydrogenase [Sphingobacteriales bacterium]